MGGVIAGDDEQAAGVLVEAVDDPRALGVIAAAEHVAKLADQGRAGVRGRRVDDEARRLVDDGEVVIDMNDPQLHPQPPPFRCALCGHGP